MECYLKPDNITQMFSGVLKTLFWVEYTNTNKLTGSCSVQPSTLPDTCYSIVMHIVVRKQWYIVSSIIRAFGVANVTHCTVNSNHEPQTADG